MIDVNIHLGQTFRHTCLLICVVLISFDVSAVTNKNLQEMSDIELVTLRNDLLHVVEKFERNVEKNNHEIIRLQNFYLDIAHDDNELLLDNNTTCIAPAEAAQAFSIMSSVTTFIGPCSEFFHNINAYVVNRKDVKLHSYGWPMMDLMFNAVYLGHLGLDYKSGDDELETLIWNAVPSVTMITVDIINMGALVTFSIINMRRNLSPESQPLLINN